MIIFFKENRELLTNIKEDILINNKMKFITWLLYSFNCLSQKTLKIQKEFDFLSSMYGKSIKFQTIDNRKGLSNSSKTSQRYINNLYEEQFICRSNLLKKSGSIIWIDNYSKFYKLTIPIK